MYKVKVNLITLSDIKKFVDIAETVSGTVSLIDNAGHCANAKSILGCMYSVEFDETYVISDNKEITNKFRSFEI